MKKLEIPKLGTWVSTRGLRKRHLVKDVVTVRQGRFGWGWNNIKRVQFACGQEHSVDNVWTEKDGQVKCRKCEKKS